MLDLGRLVLWQKVRMSCFWLFFGLAFSALFSTESILIGSIIAIATLTWVGLIIRVNLKFCGDSIRYRNGLAAHQINFADIQEAFVQESFMGGRNYLFSPDATSLGIKLMSGCQVRIFGIPTLFFNKERYIGPVVEWINWRISSDYDPSIKFTLSEISTSKHLSRRMFWLITTELIIGICCILILRVKFGFGRDAAAGGALLSWLIGGYIYDQADSAREKNMVQSRSFSEMVKSRSA